MAKFEKLNLSSSKSYSYKLKRNKASDSKKGEVHCTSFKSDKLKQHAYQDEPKQSFNSNPQPKLVLRGNDLSQGHFSGGECSK